MSLPKAKPGLILIVDDIIDNLHMLADMLEVHKHKVQIAVSGQEALEMIKQEKPDLILLDIQMPGMDGYEVCKHIKANEETSDIPVIFLSALTETTDILKGFDVGGVDYVSKPFQLREVLARVESQLAVSQQRKEIQELRERDRQQFEAISHMRDALFQGTVHDLKNPLTGILLYSETMRDDSSNDEKLAEASYSIRKLALRMQSLVSSILDIAQLQIGTQVDLVNAEIQPILQQVMNNLSKLAEEKDINLSLDMPQDAICLHINKEYFERIFDNLVSNAIKYTPEGGDVALIVIEHDNVVELIVEDNGLGIPERDLPHIFESFYRVRAQSHKQANGSGLGLAVVALMVELHDGRVNVESIEGEGSRFTVIIPRP